MKKIKTGIKRLRYYLWLMPAILFLFFFLIKPVFETLYLSFQEKIRVSEQSVRDEWFSNLKDLSGKKPGLNETVGNLDASSLKKSLGIINQKYETGLKPGDLDESMALKTASEAIYLSVLQKTGSSEYRFAGFSNYGRMFKDGLVLKAIHNNILWLFLFTFFTVSGGLSLAALIDKIRWGTVAKTFIFMPMAVSFVASGVIWKFMYDKSPHTGTVNALISSFFLVLGRIIGKHFDFNGVAFLGRAEFVNYALIFAGIWMWTGFCMVIFTAALKSIPLEIHEAAGVDGANRAQTFFMIDFPLILPTLMVVTTTMMINVLKIFDIVYTMTGGGPYGSSEVLANRMYFTFFQDGNYEYASAMAVMLFIAVIPVIVMNIRSFIIQESKR